MTLAGEHPTGGVLNLATRTVHRLESGGGEFRAACGHTRHVDRGHLQRTSVEEATEDGDVTKCGRCFEDGRGY